MLVHFDSQFTFYTNLHTSRFVLCYNKKSCLQKNTQFKIRLSTHINTFITQPNLQQKNKTQFKSDSLYIFTHTHTNETKKTSPNNFSAIYPELCSRLLYYPKIKSGQLHTRDSWPIFVSLKWRKKRAFYTV